MSNFSKWSATQDARTELHDVLGLTGAEISVNNLPAGAGVPFVHYHKKNEEIYIILSGKGFAILDGEKIVSKYIKWGMAQIISSDCHNLKNRTPNLKDAYGAVKKKYGDDYVDWFEKNARDVFTGRYVDMPVPKKPKKVIGMWL